MCPRYSPAAQPGFAHCSWAAPHLAACPGPLPIRPTPTRHLRPAADFAYACRPPFRFLTEAKRSAFAAVPLAFASLPWLPDQRLRAERHSKGIVGPRSREQSTRLGLTAVVGCGGGDVSAGNGDCGSSGGDVSAGAGDCGNGGGDVSAGITG